ncbi:type IX secretion system anionic LPS delivery protein PorZ [Brumimicrobium mesophilum]|uniref:type IX secretion system anionic LPS delivery protein PorZ n=1 Tax=Brumimicrobium mesophilum TaxID=392717 RepID=UPI000D142B11|nr:two-component regulator propeller domain-containing protein [Brumimicrobium mesophilum]
MRKIGTLLIALGVALIGNSQLGMGNWRMHISPNSAIDVVEGNDVVYAILENGLLEYDLDGEQTIWTVANYLSDVSPSAIAYDKGSANLLIGYENGNLDLIKNNSVYNLPAIVQSTVNGLKKINRIVIKDGSAYLATGVGIVVVNLGKREISDTYNPSNTVKTFIDIAFLEDSIYVLTNEGVYVSNSNNSFLADPGQWELMPNVNNYIATGGYTELETFNDKLYLSYGHDFYNGDTLFQLENGVPTLFMDEVEINGLDGYEDNLLVSLTGSLVNYDTNLTELEVLFQYQGVSFPVPQHAILINGEYFIADNRSGLVKAANPFNSQNITFGGPRYNSIFRSKWNKGKLALASGGFTGLSPSFSRKGGATMENEVWISTAIDEQAFLQGADSWDFISTAINPNDTKEVAFGSYSGIPMVITNEGVVTDTFTITNSLIEETGSTGWGYISDMEYDDQGNLWVGNANGTKPLKVRTKDGIWYEFNVGSGVNGKVTQRLIIGNNGTKWLSIGGSGILAFDEGDNIDDASDDRFKLLTTGVNNGDLPSASVEAIAEDFDGNIWVGTPEGMRVLYNAANVFDADPGQYNFQKLLIQFGENVEIVLGTTHITSIQIDGANRKWIGTASSGIFLLSPDGLEVERNFTAENSPLLSNFILDISINQENGEVFFVTEEGMISYRSDASQGSLDYDNVTVFPNPVHPNYFGPITMQGIAYDSDVKITDISGKLVYQTVSNGGTATWSGNTLDGQRAATGVYLIWTSVDDPDVKGRQVGKVVLIN